MTTRYKERLLDFTISTIDRTSSYYYRNFLTFCICFSVTHGSVDSVLDYTSSELGAILGSYSGFFLYFFYTVSALLLAKPMVQNYGPKFSLIIGLFCFLCYGAY